VHTGEVDTKMESNTTGNHEEKRVLSKKDITKLGLRSVFLQASFNYERMQAGGWLYSMLPFLKKIYKNDKQGLSNAMKDNMEFINTSPPMVPFLMGLLLSLEESKEDRSTIKGLKVALFGPIAGIGDAIFWFTILPIVAGITASFCKDGNILGPIIFFLVYLGIFFLRIFWAHTGYNLGTRAITVIKDNSEVISKAATILGVTVIGGLIASYVHIDVAAAIKISSGHKISLQKDFFDHIFPNILPFGYTFLMYYFLKHKKVSPVLLIVVTFVLSIILSFLGVL
jgi:galactosamine PTS system EIID component